MRSILFVCTANRCRSPMAKALLKTKVTGLGQADEWRIESAGTWATPGLPAMPIAQTVLGRRGLDLTDHRAQTIDGRMMQRMDLILVMTESHRESLCAEFPAEAHKVVLMSRLIGQTFNVDDPVGGAEQVYEACADELGRILDAGFERLTALAGGSQLA